MKKFIYTIAIFAAAASMSSCINDNADCSDLSAGEGAASITIGVAETTRASVNADTYPGTDSDIRIYNAQHELVRRYTALADMPAEVWLLEDSYTLDVTLGRKVSPTFDFPYYHGNGEFAIRKDVKTSVNVDCKLQNTVVKVNFDKSIRQNFDEFSVKVAAGDKFSANNSLTYDESNLNRFGYFILPSGDNKISFRFDGELFDDAGSVTKTYEGIALASDKLNGYCHEINIKYTASAPTDDNGYLSWTVKVTVLDTDDFDDIFSINPSPKPEISGEDWDMSETKIITEGATYLISSPDSDIKKLTVSCDNGVEKIIDDCSAGDKGDGISIAYVTDEEEKTRAGEGGDARNIMLIFSQEYFNGAVSGGEHTLRIRAYSSETVFGEGFSKIVTQGAFAVTPAAAAVDRWQGKGEFSAYVFDGSSASRIEIKYRKKSTANWTTATATAAEGYIYKIYDAAVNANTEYEYQLLIDGKEIGAVKSEKTENGPQIPNGGFEEWSTQGSARSPYLYDTEENQWWDTGNVAAASYVGNITNDKSDSRPESSGTKCAELTSKWALIKIAAGNIFIGKFVALDGIDGVVAFGKPFTFTYRPKAVRFWYKSKIGNINRVKNTPPNGAKSGDPDCANVYVCLTNMGGPHIVNTSKSETYMSFDNGIKTISYCTNVNGKNSTNDKTDGHVIAYYSWDNYETKSEWTMMELPLTYNDEYGDEMPNYIMITASANKYGDYYTGCDSNEMLLDDFELVY